MRSHFALAAIVLVVAAACQSGDDAPDVAGPEPVPGPVGIEAEEGCGGAAVGSPTDVAHEPDTRRFADYRPWSTDDGCLVRIDVLAERSGPDHCGFEDADVIITGTPLGELYTSPDDTQTYIRDPGGVFGRPEVAAAFEPSATLPDDAVDSGYRRDDVELWTVPDDPSSIYIVTPDATERWPLGEQTLCE